MNVLWRSLARMSAKLIFLLSVAGSFGTLAYASEGVTAGDPTNKEQEMRSFYESVNKANQEREHGITGRQSRNAVGTSGLIADYRFDGNAEDMTGNNLPMTLKNTQFVDNTLYLNGRYEYSNDGYIATAKINKLSYSHFSVSVDFYSLGQTPENLEKKPEGTQINIITGGTSYRWFGLRYSNVTSSNGHLELTLNNGDYVHTFGQVPFEPNKWHSVIVSVDLENRTISTLFDGNQLDNIILDEGFSLRVVGSTSEESDKVITFANYSNGVVFYGYIDNLKVFDRALSVSEMKTVGQANTHSLPTLGPGKAINNTGFINTTATFTGGASVDGTNYQSVLQTTASSSIGIQGSIHVASADVGKQADLLVVMGIEPHEPFDGGVDTVYYTIDGVGNFSVIDLYSAPSVWMNQLTAHPFKQDVNLTSNVLSDIGALNYLNGVTNYIFLGYRLQDGTVVYTGMPIIVTTTLGNNEVFSCAASEYGCVWFSTTEKSVCRETSDSCFENIATILRSNNISFTSSLQMNYSEQLGFYKAGCIGYREDLGGTKQGATALLKLLGDSRFYVDDNGCLMAGFNYNVILW